MDKEKPSETQTEDKGRLPNGKFGPGNTLGNRWKPGESGNPGGTPPEKLHLFRRLRKFMHMELAEIEALAKNKKEMATMTLANQVALKWALDCSKGEWQKIQEVINRDEGKVPDRIAGPEGEPLKFYSGIDQEKV